MTCPLMMSLGVYVLGAADSGERRRLEAHLPGCGECLAELRRLAPLPGLLAGIPESVRAAAPSPALRAVPPTRARARGQITRRHLTVAAAVFLAAGTAGGLWASSGFGGHTAAAVTFTGADQATHVSATATLTATSWGSSIQLHVSGIPQNVVCRLVVRSVSGGTEVSGAWNGWAEGPVSVPASVSWLPSDIASLQVATATESLVTISVSHPAAEAGR